MKRYSSHPLCKSCLIISLLLFSQFVFAVNISSKQTASVSTSTIKNGGPGKIDITANGSIVIQNAANTNAVVIDSNNLLSNLGTISINNSDNSNGVFVQGDRTSSIYSNGTIQDSEDYVRSTDSTGQPTGVYAQGTARNAIFIQGPGTFQGNITLDNSSTINVQGNASAGVKITSLLNGELSNDGSVTVIGDNAVGVDLRGGATGMVLQSGTIYTQGLNAIGVRSTGQVDGPFINDGSTISTGFASSTNSNYADPNTLTSTSVPIDQRINADNLLVGGPAVSIGGSLSQGLLNNGAVGVNAVVSGAISSNASTITNYDVNRTPGAITTYGSAPALLITPDTQYGGTGDLTIGNVVEPVRDTLDSNNNGSYTDIIATFNYAYGIINRGSITSNGLNVGFDSTAALIQGTADGSRKVIVNGGMLNAGQITASAYEADSTGLSIGPYTDLNRIFNEGSIEADVTTNTAHQATAISISQNSTLSGITNTGTIIAKTTTTGDTGTAAAIMDASGTLTNITNNGHITAAMTIKDKKNFVSGTKIAIDASSNDSAHPITISQYRLTPTTDVNGDGVINNSDVPTPSISGDILLGAGNDTLNIQAGSVNADSIDFGAGVDKLLISNGSTFSAGVKNVEDVVIDNSTVTFNIKNPMTVNQLQVKGNSQFTMNTNLSGNNLAAPRLSVTGIASFDPGTTINVHLVNFINKQVDLSLIKAGTLNLNNLQVGSSINVVTPVIYGASLVTDATSIQLSLVPKTAADLGLTGNEARTFNSFLNYAQANDTVGSALTSYSDLNAIAQAYPQLLPDYTGATARLLSSELSLATGPIGARLENLNEMGAGIWAGLSYFNATQDKTNTGVGYSGSGITMQLGLDFPLFRNFIAGFGFALHDARDDLKKTAHHEVHWSAYDTSLYFSYSLHNLKLTGVGYLGLVQNYSDRKVNFGAISDEYHGHWNSYYLSGSSRLAYNVSLDNYFITPSVTVDYFKLNQNKYAETGGGTADALGLSVGTAHSYNLSTTALLNLGVNSGVFKTNECGNSYGTSIEGGVKQIYVGYQTGIKSNPYSASVNFTNATGTPFVVRNLNNNRSSLVYGADIKKSWGCNFYFSFGYRGEEAHAYLANKIYSSIRVTF